MQQGQRCRAQCLLLWRPAPDHLSVPTWLTTLSHISQGRYLLSSSWCGMKKYVCINVSLVCFGTWTPGQAPFLWVLEIMMHERYQIIGGFPIFGWRFWLRPTSSGPEGRGGGRRGEIGGSEGGIGAWRGGGGGNLFGGRQFFGKDASSGGGSCQFSCWLFS